MRLRTDPWALAVTVVLMMPSLGLAERQPLSPLAGKGRGEGASSGRIRESFSGRSLAAGKGVALNENFIVFAPDQSLAEEVLARAGAFRKQVAEQWFGEELPPGAGAATILVRLSDTQDSGFTWAKDRPNYKFHKVSLITNRDAATGASLYHEIVHVVFATRFPDRLPAWIEEGIAGLTDSEERIGIRQRIIRRYARTGNVPDFEKLFQSTTILACDQASYSLAASVTEYLLSRGGRRKLLRFAISGKEGDWNGALEHHYGVGNVDDLRLAWRAWVTSAPTAYARAARRSSEQLAASP